jgi:hypothetical protein
VADGAHSALTARPVPLSARRPPTGHGDLHTEVYLRTGSWGDASGAGAHRHTGDLEQHSHPPIMIDPEGPQSALAVGSLTDECSSKPFCGQALHGTDPEIAAFFSSFCGTLFLELVC